MWHSSITVRCVSTAVTLKNLRTLLIWHIYVILMINSDDFAKGRQHTGLDNGNIVSSLYRRTEFWYTIWIHFMLLIATQTIRNSGHHALLDTHVRCRALSFVVVQKLTKKLLAVITYHFSSPIQYASYVQAHSVSRHEMSAAVCHLSYSARICLQKMLHYVIHAPDKWQIIVLRKLAVEFLHVIPREALYFCDIMTITLFVIGKCSFRIKWHQP
jgi:hypothetical protein